MLSTRGSVPLRYSFNRDYAAVANLADACSCDHALGAEEARVLSCLRAKDDDSPDAHASRARLSLVLLDSSTALPWDMQSEMVSATPSLSRLSFYLLSSPERNYKRGRPLLSQAAYITKLTHVSANCVLSRDEELTLLNRCVCGPDDPRYKPGMCLESLLICHNRRVMLRQNDGLLENSYRELKRPEPWNWISRWDASIL